MGERGPKLKGRVKIKWSANFAYAIGLLATDGCLYNDKRHISLVSNDFEQIKNFKKCLNLKDIKIGLSKSGQKNNVSYRIQFGDVLFYKFLEQIGLSSAKSKTIGEVDIPENYFFDFLRGVFDGDGCFYSYWDSRWKSSHMFYLTFSSASLVNIKWLQKEINSKTHALGHISKSLNKSSIYNLRYAKKESLVIIEKMYYNPRVVCLSRKKLKIKRALKVEKNQQIKYK